MDFRRFAPRLEQRVLSLDRLHGARTFLIIIRHMIDPRAHGIAPHEPGVERLEQFGRRTVILHAGIEPQVVSVWIEDHWHPVVDG